MDGESEAALAEKAASLPVSESSGGPPNAELEDECFYDCEETMNGERAADNRLREADPAGEETNRNSATDRLTKREETDLLDFKEGSETRRERTYDRGEDVMGKSDGGLGDGQSDTNETLEGFPEDEEEKRSDSDSELKEEAPDAPEFDDDSLREAEKDLAEEEKERRRAESTELKEQGNGRFKCGEHTGAEESYSAALGICPVCYSKERAILFSNRAAARLHLDKKEAAIRDCSKAIELNPNYIRAILRRAELYEKTDKLDEALEDYKNVLEKDPNIPVAREACMRLPRQIEERNEKLKEEMLSKLKDLGNMFLRPFGLSTSNFQVNQDSNSGSYSVNFVQNPNNNNR